jgi:predicted metal-dependent enzyme (double-stranded beta helix superfamily)
MKFQFKSFLSNSTFLAAAGALAVSLPVSAEDVAPSYEASADVYNVILDDEHFRVIKATFQPGQRDDWHSHESQHLIYRLTDCKTRVYAPDGEMKESEHQQGAVDSKPMVQSHSVENVGTANCELLIVEKK